MLWQVNSFIRPSSDGMHYDMVKPIRVSICPSIRPSDSPSGSPSVRLPHFSPTYFDILRWNLAYDSLLCTSDQAECRYSVSTFEGVMHLFELTIYGIRSFPNFHASYILWHIELKFCIWLCFNVLPTKYVCCHFAQFFPTWSNILSFNLAYDFVLMYYKSSSSVVTLRPSYSLHFSLTCIGKLNWNF